MFQIAVVEDEEKHRKNLVDMIKTCSDDIGIECSVKCFKNGMEFITDYKPVYDSVFLDIEMPLLDGMETAKKLRKIDNDVSVVFITNLAQYAIKGYEVDALDFIVKPIQYNSFLLKFKKVVNNMKAKNGSYIVVTSEGVIRRLNVRDIIYIEIIGHFLHYHLHDETLTQYGTIVEADKQMEPYGFFRIYKSYIVNLAHIQEIKHDSVIIDGGQELLLSRFKRKEFLNRFADYLGDR